MMYDRASKNLLNPHDLLADPDANFIDPDLESAKKKKSSFKNFTGDGSNAKKIGIFVGASLIGGALGYLIVKKFFQNG